MKIIETASYKGRRRRARDRNRRRDWDNIRFGPTQEGFPSTRNKHLRDTPSTDYEVKPDNPNYNMPVPPLDDPVAINEIRQALEDYPEVDIEVLANGLRVPVEHVRQVAESSKE